MHLTALVSQPSMFLKRPKVKKRITYKMFKCLCHMNQVTKMLLQIPHSFQKHCSNFAEGGGLEEFFLERGLDGKGVVNFWRKVQGFWR